LFATRALKERLETFAIIAWWTAATALRLPTLRVGGNVAGTLHPRGPQAKAVEHPLKFAAFLRIGAFSLPSHCFPAIEERASLITSPAKFIENIGSPRLHRCAKVLDGEVGRVASVLEILLSPFRFAGRRRALRPRAYRGRSRRTF